MSIHTTGDSHSIIGWYDIGIISHHLGPVLCYSFGKDPLNRCDIRTFNIEDGDIIIFCFGEIDCRCHIHKYINETTTYQHIIDCIIDAYFEAIKINITRSELKLKHICVYNVVPTIQRDKVKENPEFPFLGTDEERKSYVLYFNERLNEKCKEYNYIFFNIYDKYTDKNGFLNSELSDSNVHIKNGVHIKNFIYENLVI
jgi:hypothetical protein